MGRKKVLTKSGVVFNSEDHTYFLGEIQLSGVTSLIKRIVFPNQYKDVPKDVLAKAAERGSLVHEEISRYIKNGDDVTTQEAETFKTLGLNILESEFLVSDNEHYASSIDLVTKDLELIDIKTTSGGPNIEYLMWQLSIYAYLFEMQTGRKVKGLKGLWLRDDKYKIVDIDRIPDSVILDLFNADIYGLPFINPYDESEQEVSDVQIALESELAPVERMMLELNTAIASLKKKREEIYERIYEEMGDCKSWKSEDMTITKVLPTTKVSIDTAKLKRDLPDVAEKYSKVSDVKGYIKVTMNETTTS